MMLIHHLLPSPRHSHTASISKILGGKKFCELVPHKNQKRLKRQKRAGGERDGDADEEGLSSAPDARPGDVSGTLADEATSRRSGRLSPEWSCDSPRVEVSTAGETRLTADLARSDSVSLCLCLSVCT